MTKNIEGTVDDDIAAKLAIGEGRQVFDWLIGGSTNGNTRFNTDT